jgi:molecular chaperone HtpG
MQPYLKGEIDMCAQETKEKIEFKAEVAQVLNLVIHSLYSHKEVFLRELISNASDAIDKHRHLSLMDSQFEKPKDEYAIKIELDKKKKTLTISDNGIGMNREDVLQNLGTIASSGTKAFLEQMSKSKDKNALQLIGQFGVGFYSSFMVAEKVNVHTRKAGEEQKGILWSSDGQGDFTVEELERSEVGTSIELSLKKDSIEYLEDYSIREIVKKYSDYVSYPIKLKKEKDEEETINKVTAIWRRPKSEIKDEEYNEFYKYISHDFEDPLLHSHVVVEGKIEYRMLIFLPKRAPVNFFREDIRGIRLHVKKMFVTDECKELLPVYLRFVKGIVDSEDLPLNVSREVLQQNAVIHKIKQQLTKRVFDLLEDLSKKDPEKYNAFYKELGVAFKEGLTMDMENRDRLISFLRYKTSLNDGEKDFVSLADYVTRTKEDQKEIYYISGSNLETVKQSPHLEFFKSQGIEVLYMTDAIDEWVIPAISLYEGKKLKSITQGEINTDSVGKELEKEKATVEPKYKDLISNIKTALSDQVKDVRLSMRLKASPCCLVTDEGDMDIQMEQIMRAMNKEVPKSKRILELNPEHAILKNMLVAFENKKAADGQIKNWSEILYHQALIAEGSAIKDPARFVQLLSDLMSDATQK